MVKVCANPDCGQPFETSRRKYPELAKMCSRRCAAAVQRDKLTEDGRRLGGLHSSRVRRERALARLADLDPLAIYQLGYRQGYQKAACAKRRGAVISREELEQS